MDKKKLIFIFILFDILGIALYFIFFYNKGTINKSETDFSVKDTTQISKVLIIYNTDTLAVERSENKWMVNNTFEAKPEVLKQMVSTLQLIQLKSPVPENAQEFVKKNLFSSKKIEVYSNENKLKSFYIGSQTSDLSSNYIMLSNAESAYIAFIPTLNVDINEKFPDDESLWKNNIIFDFTPSEIVEVSINYPFENENTFTISNQENNIKLYNYKNEPVQNFDNEKLIRFLTYFSDVRFQNFVHNINTDSIYKMTCFAEIELKLPDSKSKQIKCFKINENTNNFIGIIDSKDIVFIKYYDFDLILKKIDYFKNI